MIEDIEMAEFESFDSKGNPKPSKDKKGSKIWVFWVVLIVALIAVKACLVVTYENQYKLIRRFGKVERVIGTSGISFKIPFIETVDIVPDEILLYDLPASDVTAMFCGELPIPSSSHRPWAAPLPMLRTVSIISYITLRRIPSPI